MLHHLDLYVKDLPKQTAFWSRFLKALGYQEYQNWATGISWKKENFYFVISIGESKMIETPYVKGGIGLNHVAFATETKNQVDTLRKQIPSFGGTLLYDDEYPFAGGPHHYALYFQDPEGMKMELVAIES